MIGARKAAYVFGPRRALREVEAPPDVDTLRDTECPVCGAGNSFQGDSCSTCHAPKPPKNFMAPDTSKAGEVERVSEEDPSQVGEGIDPMDPDDVGQEHPDADPDADGVDEFGQPPDPNADLDADPDEMGEEGGDLICPACGSTFASVEGDDEEQQPHMDAAAETEPLAEDPMAQMDPEVEDDMAETAYEPGDECPVCGEGELVADDQIADDPDNSGMEDPEDIPEYDAIVDPEVRSIR